MKKVLFITLCVLFALAGCSKEQKSEELPEFVEVVIELPEIIKVNEEVVIEAHIKQGNEKVEDAQKVEFELWKSDQETHEKILGDHQGDGIYSISKTFLKEGVTCYRPCYGKRHAQHAQKGIYCYQNS